MARSWGGAMTHIRRNVHRLQPGWNPAIFWYARAVRELQRRPLNDPTGWRFLAAMHGFDKRLWGVHGYFSAFDTPPTAKVQDRLWRQCQHQSWYFLPWHRGYLAAFEAIIRATVADLGGPSDWALPYWNYHDGGPRSKGIPDVFLAPIMPDGSANPLRADGRWGGPNEDGSGALVDLSIATLRPALEDDRFERPAPQVGVTGGFGGPQTQFNWHTGANGALEANPHNFIHGMTGGFQRRGSDALPGLMSHPWTAALDPIFWLHHANIDRLWEVWRTRALNHTEPTAPDWLQGPIDRAFEVPDPSGAFHVFVAADMLDTRAPNLDYEYDDITDPLIGGSGRLLSRLNRFSLGFSTDSSSFLVRVMDETTPIELIGANSSAVSLARPETVVPVRMDREGSRKLQASFLRERTASEVIEPDRVFLNIEGVRGRNDALIFKVYLNLPHDAEPSEHPDLYAGAFSLFGVDQASRSDSPHGGGGLTQVIEITRVVDYLQFAGEGLPDLSVRFVAQGDVQPEDRITVDRISVYRLGE